MARIGISPVVLLIIVILAIGFFILGLVQILVRFLTKRPSFPPVSRANRLRDLSNSHSLQRQLQHLFRMHDSGLDQAVIDTLPVFYYKDITGGEKEPFDCAVCLCEFSEGDRLKLLPKCSHAFHAHCIETWLLSNSTCPLCRSHIACNNLTQQCTLPRPDNSANPHEENQVFPVFLGKFRSTNANENEGVNNNTSCSSTIDARRCFSMGTYRYIVNDANLQVALMPNNNNAVCNNSAAADIIGKKISPRSKDDSFSLSKIWLWSKKDRFPSIDETNERAMLPMPNQSELA